jgi:hypothetical protein
VPGLSDLPPGVSASDIPGNRPEDVLAEKLYELFGEAWQAAFTEEDIVELWRDAAKDEAAKIAPEQPENPYCPRCHRATMFATNDDGEFVSVCCAASPQPVERQE